MEVYFKKDSCVLRKVTGTFDWKQEREFHFWIDGEKYTIPKGRLTDLSSTPRILWPIFPKSGKYTEAGVIHDYLYRNGVLPRKDCDVAYKELMRFCGVGSARSGAAYRALRLFGSKNYIDR